MPKDFYVSHTLERVSILCSGICPRLYLNMSSKHRNSEIYVKGYDSKHNTKEDLREWFREFGRISQVQFKGPYSFIVQC
jgi:hypothetical protein